VKLTVQEKILLHLYLCRRREDPDERQTRMGIAKVCGVSESFVAGELCKLMKTFGWVFGCESSARGRTRRRLIAYSLTQKGEYAAEELIREIVALRNKILPLMKEKGVR
jgi:hypothetical protein